MFEWPSLPSRGSQKEDAIDKARPIEALRDLSGAKPSFFSRPTSSVSMLGCAKVAPPAKGLLACGRSVGKGDTSPSSRDNSGAVQRPYPAGGG
jgi:hypothetical protein